MLDFITFYYKLYFSKLNFLQFLNLFFIHIKHYTYTTFRDGIYQGPFVSHSFWDGIYMHTYLTNNSLTNGKVIYFIYLGIQRTFF